MHRETVTLLLDTLRLSSNASPDSLRARWAAASTAGLLALVRHEGAEVWLYRRLRQLGIEAPAPLHKGLRDLVHETSITNMRIDAQTVAVLTRLEGAGVPCVLIKGQARRAAEDRYPWATARGVSDVDLLVPESRADEAWRLLVANGFRPLIEGPVDWKADHHRPAIIDDSNVCVELHTTTTMTVAAGEAWRRATTDADPVTWSGLTTSVPNATELVWQALSHAVADGPRSYSLRAFLSVAAVLAVRPPIDWTVLETRVRADEVTDNETGIAVPHERVRRFVAVAADLADVKLPAFLTPARPVELVPLLQWRGRVLERRFGRALRERLLEEALRSEALLPITPAAPGTSLLLGFRRRSSSMVARAVYTGWRVLQ